MDPGSDPTVLRQLKLNRAMILAERATNLMQRLAKLPAASFNILRRLRRNPGMVQYKPGRSSGDSRSGILRQSGETGKLRKRAGAIPKLYTRCAPRNPTLLSSTAAEGIADAVVKL
jgi:hypothetical protein